MGLASNRQLFSLFPIFIIQLFVASNRFWIYCFLELLPLTAGLGIFQSACILRPSLLHPPSLKLATKLLFVSVFFRIFFTTFFTNTVHLVELSTFKPYSTLHTQEFAVSTWIQLISVRCCPLCHEYLMLCDKLFQCLVSVSKHIPALHR